MRRFDRIGLLAPFVLFTVWLLYFPWPAPEIRPVPWKPDAIVALGGGDNARARRATRLASAFPDAVVILTGDSGHMEGLLRADPATRGRLIIEPHATSTWENAVFTEPLLEQVHVQRAILVTNWFHAPRTEAVFRKAIPWLEFEIAFEPAPDPLPPWDLQSRRREKIAAIWYLLRYGVNSF
jgi:uncharacterized SAM-binding protein YcdF (DUF218 family)